jgi:thiamine transport system permease protein
MGCGDEKLKAGASLKWLGTLPVVYISLFFALPIAALAQEVISVSIPGRFQESNLWASTVEVAFGASVQALLSALVAVVVGFPLAGLLVNYEFPFRAALQSLVYVPFVLPTLVTGIAIRQMLGGVISPGLLLLVVAHAYVNLAVIVRVVGSAWQGIDRRLIISAQTLGATPAKVLTSIVIPLIKSAILRAFALVFVFSFSSLGLVLVLGGGQQTLETRLLRQVSLLVDFPAAAVTASMQLFVVLAVLLLTGRSKSEINQPTRFAPKQLPKSMYGAVVIAIAAFTAPLIWLLHSSFSTSQGISLSNWNLVLRDFQTWQALGNSIEIALITAGLTAVIGIAAAMAVNSGRLSKFSGVLVVPLSVSSVTIGLGLLLAVRSREILVVPDWLLPSIAHSLVALPFVVAILLPPVKALDFKWNTAAAALGAKPLQAQATAIMPILKAALPAVFSLSVAISLGEFGAASFLADYENPTLSVVLLRLLNRPAVEAAGMASVLAVILMIATILLTLIWQQYESSKNVRS